MPVCEFPGSRAVQGGGERRSDADMCGRLMGLFKLNRCFLTNYITQSAKSGFFKRILELCCVPDSSKQPKTWDPHATPGCFAAAGFSGPAGAAECRVRLPPPDSSLGKGQSPGALRREPIPGRSVSAIALSTVGR